MKHSFLFTFSYCCYFQSFKMPSQSTSSRTKMKQEHPEKYQQYLESQRKRSAEYRKKMKQALTNPTKEEREKGENI